MGPASKVVYSCPFSDRETPYPSGIHPQIKLFLNCCFRIGFHRNQHRLSAFHKLISASISPWCLAPLIFKSHYCGDSSSWSRSPGPWWFPDIYLRPQSGLYSPLLMGWGRWRAWIPTYHSSASLPFSMWSFSLCEKHLFCQASSHFESLLN